MAKTPEAPAGTWVDPWPAYNFKVFIQKEPIAHFIECYGIGGTVHTMEYREAGQQQLVHQIPTITTYTNVTLKYGLTASTMLFNWFYDITRGRIRRENVSIMMLDAAGATTVMHWILVGAFPVRWTGASLRATAREVAIAETEFSYDYFELGE